MAEDTIGATEAQDTGDGGAQPLDQPLSYDSMVDDMAALLLDDGDGGDSQEKNTTSGSEDAPDNSMIDLENHQDVQDAAQDDSSEDGSSSDEDTQPPTKPVAEDPEEDDEPPTPELAADGLPRPKGEKANQRITQLVAQKNEAKKRAEEAEARAAAAEQRAATTTKAHPDPEAELKDLKKRYQTLKTPQQVIEEGLINPMTGYEYTPAEAQAAIADYKQDLQFQIAEAQAATVERMNQARASENLVVTQLNPEVDAFLLKYPELDENNAKYDKDLGFMFDALIAANMKTEQGLVTGFKTPPKEYIATFERMMLNGRTMKVNAESKTNKKIDKVPAKKALDNRGKDDKISPEDELMGYFDAAMKDMGYSG